MIKCIKIAAAVVVLTLAGCATWSTSSVDNSSADAKPTITSEHSSRKDPSKIEITDKDIVNRKYQPLGDVTVTVNKTTIFNKDPTQEMVNIKLQEKAAELGADAVILVRYGNGGISLFSWGSLEGKGRAIKFVQ
jgi:ABC-type glycerol-3-phosphate transport system substrate-binding protein